MKKLKLYTKTHIAECKIHQEINEASAVTYLPNEVKRKKEGAEETVHNPISTTIPLAMVFLIFATHKIPLTKQHPFNTV